MAPPLPALGLLPPLVPRRLLCVLLLVRHGEDNSASQSDCDVADKGGGCEAACVVHIDGDDGGDCDMAVAQVDGDRSIQ